MTAPRLILTLFGLIFIGFGLAFLISPGPMAALAEVEVPTPMARTDVRAVYGGLELGIGAFLLTMVGRREHVALGLRAALCAGVGMAAGRMAGLAADGWWQPVMWLFGAVELVAAGLAWWGITAVHAAQRDEAAGASEPDRTAGLEA
jgi:hypothetical protein